MIKSNGTPAKAAYTVALGIQLKAISNLSFLLNVDPTDTKQTNTLTTVPIHTIAIHFGIISESKSLNFTLAPIRGNNL